MISTRVTQKVDSAAVFFLNKNARPFNTKACEGLRKGQEGRPLLGPGHCLDLEFHSHDHARAGNPEALKSFFATQCMGPELLYEQRPRWSGKLRHKEKTF
jgi:hypothetical protein